MSREWNDILNRGIRKICTNGIEHDKFNNCFATLYTQSSFFFMYRALRLQWNGISNFGRNKKKNAAKTFERLTENYEESTLSKNIVFI